MNIHVDQILIVYSGVQLHAKTTGRAMNMCVQSKCPNVNSISPACSKSF